MKDKKPINFSFATLRIYLSFLVVTFHCFKPKSKVKKELKIKIIYNSFHVPIFYILSFYYCYKLFKSKDIRKIKLRFQRLLIPYFIWPIIIWLLQNLLSFLLIKIDRISFNNLILQLLTGHVFMIVLWFQYNLIFITLLIVIIHFLFNDKIKFYLLINLSIFGIFFTNSNYNYFLFSHYIHINFTFGRFFEIIPYCITGYFLAYLKLVDIFKKNRIILINIFLSNIILITKYDLFLKIKGFCYQGIKLYILSISIFIIFSLIPNERFGNKYIRKFIEYISNYTAGIYFIHLPLYNYLQIFPLFKYKTLTGVIIIYVIAFFISLFGNLIFCKTKLINLFQ